MTVKLPPAFLKFMTVFILLGSPNPVKAAADTLLVNGRYEHPYLEQADSLAGKNMPYEALEAYRLVLRKFSGENDLKGWITAACKMAGLYIDLRQFTEAESSLSEALRVFKEHSMDDVLLADIYYHFGVFYDKKIQPDSALFYYHRSLDIRRRNVGENSEPVASSYNAIAGIYRYTFLDYAIAEKYYLQALEIREQLPFKDQLKNMATLCYNLATTQRLKGDTEKAITYAYQAQTFYQLHDPKDFLYSSICQNALANTFFTKYDYGESVKHFRNAIEYINHLPSYSARYLPNFFTNLGGAYIELNQPDSALYYLKKAISILEQTGDSVQMAHTYQQMGAAHSKIKSDAALLYYQKSMDLKRRVFGDDHPQNARLHFDFAKYYKSIGDYKTAIAYIKKSLVILQYEKLVNDAQQQQTVNVDVDAILESLALLSSSHLHLYYQTKKLADLEGAFENYLLLDRVLTNFRNLMARESSRLELAKDFKNTYEEALDCAYALYQLRPSDDVADAAFRFMEKNKSLVLLDFLRHAESSNMLGISDSIRNHERSLEAKLAFYTAEFYSPEEGNKADLQSKIFVAERELEKLRNNLATKYPEYFKIKYSSKNFSLSDCMSYLKEKETTLIEYFYGDSALYILAINPENKDVIFHKITDHITNEPLVDSFIGKLHKGVDIGNVDLDFEAYVQSAYGLYRMLLAPVLSDKNFLSANRNLIVVPDGILSFVPFEALIDNLPSHKRADYQGLSYLINRFAFSYSFSAQVMMEDIQSINRTYPDNTLVFSHDKSSETHTPLVGAIAGTSKEADHIASLLSATVFSGTDATKSNFKQHAKDAGIIHLALHGKADQVNPMKGAVLFRAEGSGAEDEYLYYYELIELAANARLAVLSACETGHGKHLEGEGVFHLARGFRYAGCPSLIASLWRIDDRSTAGIVEGFYRELIGNKSLDLALQESKRKYINSADELLAHPHYWAGMLLIGEKAPVVLGERYQPWHYTLGIMLLVFLLLLLFLKVRKSFYSSLCF